MTGEDIKEFEKWVTLQLVVESVSNIRTVVSLGRERDFWRRYCDLIRVPHRRYVRQAPIRGMSFGISQSIPFFAYSLCMYYGGYLVDTEGLEYQEVFRSVIVGAFLVLSTTKLQLYAQSE